MGLFSRGPEKVINDGQRLRARIAAIEVSQRSENDSTVRVDEYVIELSAMEGGRRLSLRQDLAPAVNVRYGMEVWAWVREDDAFIDWQSTLAEQRLDGTNVRDNWKGGRDASRTGIVDSRIDVVDALKKGERGSMVINQLRWDEKFGGLVRTLTIAGTVTLGTDEPYDVEIGRQQVPHYASHLPSVGRRVPVIVSLKRLDKVLIDWPSATMAEPGIGVPPSTQIDEALDRTQSATTMGDWLGGGKLGGMVDNLVAPPAPPSPTDFVPPPPIEGVSWSQYLAIEKAILANGGHNRKAAALVESYGFSYATYMKAVAEYGKLMRRDAALQQSYAAAMR